MWENIVERNRPQVTIWRMRIACWIIKATNAHTSCVIRIAFPMKEWLNERTRRNVTFYVVLVAFTKKCCRIMLSSFAVSRDFYVKSRESVNRSLLSNQPSKFTEI
jgi:hypothetical protein